MTSAQTKKSSIENDTVFNGEKEISVGDIRKFIPAEYFVKRESRFLISVLYSLSLTLFTAFLADRYLRLEWAYLPLWIAYAVINGTIATGLWVLGHECGHKAFSNSDVANDSLGYILHTALLVPYFSWQWSHHVHHSKCNHLTEGETHVPRVDTDPKASMYIKLRDIIGVESFSIWQVLNILVIGWPAYLIFGATGGPARGFSSHFIVPNKLFTKDKLLKVHLSNLGLVIVGYLLYLWARQTSFTYVFAIYFGPYLVVNAWLTGITFLQHTEDTVPHYDKSAWSWLRGALCTIDRNYPEYINALHFDIGSTHVIHHIFHEMPHYNAREANIYLKQILGPAYIKDKKSVTRALFEAGKLACVSEREQGFYYWK
ncbi:fatty acid desaturase (macronuclear) [Tetrahymena thermophila SB210]|uniref:Fatty acid desaturase n=1 Tax=Tetrahymena thermophila (strain SB210) TaxID=312017 RepID=I7MA19_TETTS|nr:fatty acid desaturase [Tetrahymena thermophila SB210]EAS03232.2 fatty acid desaturase [Tetrahymena thermophila SB210]|eukprot:XP_001023477.2 fatty acid desaturase [Tetrahymena thermophila SB210]